VSNFDQFLVQMSIIKTIWIYKTPKYRSQCSQYRTGDYFACDLQKAKHAFYSGWNVVL